MEKNPTLLFVAAAALINENRKILMQTRPLGKSMAGLWEFPGGKIESMETPEKALARELQEELNVEINPEKLVAMSFASEPLDEKNLLLLLYCIDEWEGEITPKEGQKYDWFSLEQLRKLKMPPADIPLVENLNKLLSYKD